MKTLFTFALCLFAVVAHAANPSTKSFRATGGLAVTSNDITGLITYDGSGISSPTGGVSATMATNIVESRIGPSTSGGKAMTNVLWPNTLFVNSTNGTNATAIRGDLTKPWRDVRVAFSNALSGDVVWALNGIHDVGSNTVVVPDGVQFFGQGIGTVIRGSGGLLKDGPVVVPGSTTEVAHLSFQNSGRHNYPSAAFGFYQWATNGAQRGPTNAYVHHIYMLGASDCIYLRATNHWDLRAHDIYSFAKFDSLVQSYESSNGVSRWQSCYFESDLNGALDAYSISAGNATAVKIAGGVAEFIGCEAVGTNGTITTRGLAAVAGVTHWIGGSITAAGTNTDVFAASREDEATLIYSGNQLRIEDINEGATGSTIWGSEQTVLTNIFYANTNGLIIRDRDGFTSPIKFSFDGGLNIGGLTNVPGGRLQVSSLPGSGDYVASDANGLLFSTNGSAGGGSLVTNANQFAANPTLTIMSEALTTNLNVYEQFQSFNGTATNLDINGNSTLMYPQTANTGAFTIGAQGAGRYFAFSKSAGFLNMGSGAADTFKFNLGTGAQTNAGALGIAGAASFFNTVSIPTGATSNYVWTCTNATTGMGEWRASTGSGGSNYLFDAAVFNAVAAAGNVDVGVKSGAILPGVYADNGLLYGGGVLDYGIYYDTGIDTLYFQDARFAPNYTNVFGISNGFANFFVAPVLNDLPAGSLLRTTSAKRVGAVTVGSGLTWDGTTLTSTGGSGSGETNFNGEASVTNATKIGLVHGKTGVTNTLRSLQAGSGIVLTNQGTNIVIASTGSGGLAGHSNAIAFINPQGTALTYYDSGSSLTNPGFGFDPRVLNGPNAGYGGLLVFANESMGLVTIGHPNPGSDFTGNTASALVVSNRFAPANQGFTSDFVKIDAVEVTGGGGTSFNPDSTLTRWRVWSAASGSSTSTASNDVAAITVDGRLKLSGGLLTGVGSSGQGSISFSTNHYKEGVATVTPSVERQLTNANPGINVSLPVAGITNQRVNVPLTNGQILTYNGTAYVASNLPPVLTNAFGVEYGQGTNFALTATPSAVLFQTNELDITLPAGTYLLHASVVIINGSQTTDPYEVKIRNTTDASDVGTITSVGSLLASAGATAHVHGITSITGTKTFKIYAANTAASRGYILGATNYSQFHYVKLL